MNKKANAGDNRDAKPGQEVDGLRAEFKFRETTEAGGRPDAIMGCVVYNPKWPLKCSMNDLIIFGDNPVPPVILNVTSVKLHI
jgi:hypothetical protein